MRAPKVIFDIVLLALYLVAANPALTGVPFHEYLGAGIFVLMVAHVVASGEGLGGRGRWAQRVLNGALLVALAFCVVSGALVSGTLLPSLGFYATGYYFWGPLHALSAKVLLAALLVHVVLRAPGALAVFRHREAQVEKRVSG
ncbi:DUF4405 domain-containing protein [Adlercreutzia equolifaciens]|uniref:DUF4405 domain-containing protein n=1 Tax=Adlercreutzia equolifaciens TaxID=446660 RepID=UPI0039F535A5